MCGKMKDKNYDLEQEQLPNQTPVEDDQERNYVCMELRKLACEVNVWVNQVRERTSQLTRQRAYLRANQS